MKSYAAAIAATVALALMAFGLGALVYNAGRTKERVIWIEKEKLAAQTFARQLDKEIKRGAVADAKYQADLAQLRTTYFTLESKYEDLRGRVPLVVYRPAVAAKPAASGAASTAPARPSRRRGASAALLALGSATALSGCGTAALPALMYPPVPAALLTPPAQPVLLMPASASKKPGATSTPTQKAAPSTASGTAR